MTAARLLAELAACGPEARNLLQLARRCAVAEQAEQIAIQVSHHEPEV